MGSAADRSRDFGDKIWRDQVGSTLKRLTTDVTRLLRFQARETYTPDVNAEQSPLASGSTGGLCVRVTLSGSLSAGGSATATRADTGTTITVYDWLLSSGQSIAGNKKGIAMWDGSAGTAGRWYLISAQCG